MAAAPETPRSQSLFDIAKELPDGGFLVHGAAIAIAGRGVLFFGPSGAGKSQAALGMMALGATLIADDQLIIDTGPVLRALPDTPGLIEARGVGLLATRLEPVPVPFALAIDLNAAEPQRLPPSRVLDCSDAEVPLILAAGHPNLAPVVMQYLRGGRSK
ncbi:MAG: serine kinase [Pseudomonadota bacterium]